tara:strand:+ start:2585 stop:3076 length:492 start_codon:yes stop_codon:yes gene_type:complete
MFSPHELNTIMRLDWPKQRIVRWHPTHFNMMTLNEFDKRNLPVYQSKMNLFENLIDKGLCFTGMQEKKIYAMFGMWELWSGVYEAWLIPSADISEKTFRFHRSAKLFFDYAVNKLSIKRLQIMVCSDNVLAVRWAKVCYFEIEGTAKKWGPLGEDYYMMARVF